MVICRTINALLVCHSSILSRESSIDWLPANMNSRTNVTIGFMAALDGNSAAQYVPRHNSTIARPSRYTHYTFHLN